MNKIGGKYFRRAVIPPTCNNIDSKEKISRNCRSTFKTSIYEILRIFSKFLYFLCLTPHTIQIALPKDNSNGNANIEFVTSKFRQIVSILIHFVCNLTLGIYLRVALAGPSIQSQPEKLFRIATEAAFLLACFSFAKICLKHKNGLTSLLKVTDSYYGFQNESNKMSTKKNRAIATGFCLIIVGITTRNLARDIGLGKSFEPPTVKSICEKAYAHLGLGWFTGQSQLEICSSDGWSYSYQIVLGVWYIFGSVCLSLIGNCTDAIVTFISFSFYILATEFWVMVQQVGTSSSEEFNQVCQLYYEMKSLTEEINRIIGVQVFLGILTAIPYFASNFISVFDTEDWAERIETMYYLICYLISLTLAAEAHRKIQELPSYIYKHFKNCEGVDAEQKNLFISEVFSTQIGLKGHGFFTITYSYLGSVVGVLLTYIIILLQFQSSAHTKNTGIESNGTTQPPIGNRF